VIHEGIARRVFPAAVVDVGNSLAPRWREAFGTLTFVPDSPRSDEATIFDLASLTKVIATTTLVMQQIHAGQLRLDEPLSSCFAEWRDTDRERAAVQDLLEHSSGLPARLVDLPPDGAREFEHEICAMPLEYEPRTRSVYSDLGFILLGLLLADRGKASLAAQFESLRRALGQIEADLATEVLSFGVESALRVRVAPTLPEADDARRGRTLVGEVHDSYAAALNGVAGHAGLFGTAAAVSAFARIVLRAARGDRQTALPLSSSLVRRFVTKGDVPGSSRALGWDTMLLTSSCGAHMSPTAFGHVGFTGTSLWIDPERDRYFVLLSNRACNGGSLDEIRTVRRAFHDALGTF
jgi:CubicO group peptidase (beta-lactamase class C family)